LRDMDTARLQADRAPESHSETAAERQRRFAWEAAMIAEADAEIEAGLFVDAADVDAWIDSIGTDHELPLPATRRR
jgi:predicted transcriptional regulator